MNSLEVIHPATGEVLNLKTGKVEDISKMLLQLDTLSKKIEEAKKAAQRYLEQNRLVDGKFGEWTVSTANKSSIKLEEDDLPKDVRAEYREAMDFIKDIKKQYGQEILTQYTQWRRPKF
jgi:hypothetical protein